jgi:hypothetical protein
LGWDPHEWNYSIEPENSQMSHTTVGTCTLFSHTVNTRTDVQAIYVNVYILWWFSPKNYSNTFNKFKIISEVAHDNWNTGQRLTLYTGFINKYFIEETAALNISTEWLVIMLDLVLVLWRVWKIAFMHTKMSQYIYIVIMVLYSRLIVQEPDPPIIQMFHS